jgi:2-polyprenyl-6-methoxyphenol hydroxylase-like FAD-dependent oxidoreductase
MNASAGRIAAVRRFCIGDAMDETCDVAIVGGGPVGLLLGCLLTQRGVEVRVFEPRAAPHAHSRAVGIHPPGLACLADVGAAEELIASGIRVQRGFALRGARVLGEVSFRRLPGPYPFVLSVPQSSTEAALERRLFELAPDSLRRGHEVLDCRVTPQHAELTVRCEREYAVRARFVVGCDGKRSVVRRAAGIRYTGAPYRDNFVMADVRDETSLGPDAAIFLSREGLVESFPLPGGVRRWVVGLGAERRPAEATAVEALVASRTGQVARASTATMVSAFVPERYLAHTFTNGRMTLAGDAAHVLSPIGGQGMSLGWLDARMLADLLEQALAQPQDSPQLLASYSPARRRVARAAIRRAELFMTIGQTRRFAWMRDCLVSGLLSAPLVDRTAQMFTMRGFASQALT